MRIDFECTGGFANLRLAYHANTDELSRELAEEVLRLVERSMFFDLQSSEVASMSSGPADVFFYKLSLSEGSRKKSLSFNDVTAPVTLHPLLSFLQKLALDQRRKAK